MNTLSWEEEVVIAVESDDIDRALRIVNQQGSGKRGKPKGKVKNFLVNAILDNFEPKNIYAVAVKLANIDDETAKMVAAHLLIEVYDVNPNGVMEKLHTLANDDNWEVREWVAGACGDRLTQHFDSFYPLMEKWAQDDLANVRRAAVLAAKYAGKTRNPKYAEPLLNLLESVITDSDLYVKKNLGPFAIGDGMIRFYPDETRRRLEKWIQFEDENARWNIAKIFTTASGAKFASEVIDILTVLVNDDRRTVVRAVTSAMKNLQKRNPDVFEKLNGEVSK